MNKIVKWSIIIFLIVLITIAAIMYYLGKDLQNATLEKFELSGVEDITLDTITLNGNLYVNNPSRLSVPIKEITYEIILEKDNATLSSGVIPGFVLEKNTITKIPFNQKLKYAPTASFALQMATQQHVYANINGKIFIDLPKTQYEIPFSYKIDIKEAIKQKRNEKI